MRGAGVPAVERLLSIIERFRDRRVAVAADLVADEFFHGDIERVSREAPVLILRQTRTEVVPGGGGNVVVNIRALGARPLPVGIVGRDEPGRRLRETLRGLGVSTAGIRTVPGYETPTKTRIIAGGVHTRRQQMVRLDRGSRPGSLSDDVTSAAVERLTAILPRAEGLLLADYGHGAATPGMVRDVEKSGLLEGIPVTVDSRQRVSGFRGLTACTPNQEELENALLVDASSVERDLESAGRSLLRKTGHRAVVVTRGAKGMALFERRKPTRLFAAYGSDEVADVTGAGDTVIAVFTLALISGADFDDAARLANYAAGLVVMKAGTATVSRNELRDAVVEDNES